MEYYQKISSSTRSTKKDSSFFFNASRVNLFVKYNFLRLLCHGVSLIDASAWWELVKVQSNKLYWALSLSALNNDDVSVRFDIVILWLVWLLYQRSCQLFAKGSYCCIIKKILVTNNRDNNSSVLYQNGVTDCLWLNIILSCHHYSCRSYRLKALEFSKYYHLYGIGRQTRWHQPPDGKQSSLPMDIYNNNNHKRLRCFTSTILNFLTHPKGWQHTCHVSVVLAVYLQSPFLTITRSACTFNDLSHKKLFWRFEDFPNIQGIC